MPGSAAAHKRAAVRWQVSTSSAGCGASIYDELIGKHGAAAATSNFGATCAHHDLTSRRPCRQDRFWQGTDFFCPLRRVLAIRVTTHTRAHSCHTTHPSTEDTRHTPLSVFYIFNMQTQTQSHKPCNGHTNSPSQCQLPQNE